MRAIAERLVIGHPAAAERNDGSPREPERVSFGVFDRKLAFDANWSVVDNGDFGGHEPRS